VLVARVRTQPPRACNGTTGAGDDADEMQELAQIFRAMVSGDRRKLRLQ
jgi:hypothetical protein